MDSYTPNPVKLYIPPYTRKVEECHYDGIGYRRIDRYRSRNRIYIYIDTISEV